METKNLHETKIPELIIPQSMVDWKSNNYQTTKEQIYKKTPRNDLRGAKVLKEHKYY